MYSAQDARHTSKMGGRLTPAVRFSLWRITQLVKRASAQGECEVDFYRPYPLDNRVAQQLAAAGYKLTIKNRSAVTDALVYRVSW